jgi:hypothetical protein
MKKRQDNNASTIFITAATGCSRARKPDSDERGRRRGCAARLLRDAAVGDGDLAGGLAGGAAELLDCLDDFRAGDDLRGGSGSALDERMVGGGEGGDDLAEDDVLAVEPRGGHGGDEELAAVGVGT